VRDLDPTHALLAARGTMLRMSGAARTGPSANDALSPRVA
jgi:hypothetical protein